MSPISLLIIYTLFLLLIWRLGCRRKNILRTSLYVVYIISAITSLIISIFDFNIIVETDTLKLIPLIYLFISIILWNEAYSKFGEEDILYICNNNQLIRNEILNFSIFYLPITIFLFYKSINILTSVDLSVYRSEGNYFTYIGSGDVYSYIWVFIQEMSALSFIPQILFFLSLTRDTKVIERIILFFESFAFVFMTLCYAGRDGILFWIMNTIILYYIFKSKIRNKNIIKKMIIVFCMLIFIIFIIISIKRFIYGSFDFKILLGALLSYGGQQVFNFNKFFNMSNYEYSHLTIIEKNVFSTFIGSLTHLIGKFYTLLLSIIQLIFIRNIRIKSLYDFLIIYTLFQIPLYGVFYYRQGLGHMILVYFIFIIYCLIIKSYLRYPLKNIEKDK